MNFLNRLFGSGLRPAPTPVAQSVQPKQMDIPPKGQNTINAASRGCPPTTEGDIEALKRLLNDGLDSRRTIRTLQQLGYTSPEYTDVGVMMSNGRGTVMISTLASRHPTNMWSCGYGPKGESTVWLIDEGKRTYATVGEPKEQKQAQSNQTGEQPGSDKFTPETLHTAWLVGSTILDAADIWRSGLGSPYWTESANRELSGMRRCMNTAQRNISDSIAKSQPLISRSEAFGRASQFFNSVTGDRELCSDFRKDEVSLFYLVSEAADAIGHGVIVRALFDFYKKM